MTLHPVARSKVRPGGRIAWVGGLIKHKGHPFVVDCGHRHDTRQEAIECAACLVHADRGSIVADLIEKAS